MEELLTVTVINHPIMPIKDSFLVLIISVGGIDTLEAGIDTFMVDTDILEGGTGTSAADTDISTAGIDTLEAVTDTSVADTGEEVIEAAIIVDKNHIYSPLPH